LNECVYLLLTILYFLFEFPGFDFFILEVCNFTGKLVQVCRRFFDEFPKAEYLVNAVDSEVVTIIQPLGQYYRKLKQIKGAAEFICKKGNRIIDDARELRQITGVGSKLSECVIGYGLGKAALPVDINVIRVLYRVYGKNPARAISSDYDWVRNKLKGMLDESEWIDTHELLRLHAISICQKRHPKCKLCPLIPCRSREEFCQGIVGISRARKEARRVLDTEWEPCRQLICEP